MSVFQHNAVTFNTDELGDTVFHQVNVGIVYISKEKKDRCIWHRNTSKVELGFCDRAINPRVLSIEVYKIPKSLAGIPKLLSYVNFMCTLRITQHKNTQLESLGYYPMQCII